MSEDVTMRASGTPQESDMMMSMPEKATAIPDRGLTPSGCGQNFGIRVLCVDDHAVLVEGLKARFEVDGTIGLVGHLPSADRLITEVDRLRPDVVVLDVEMPGADVFEIADRLHRMRPNLRFIFLSAHIKDGYLAAAYRAGAWGYFAKGDEISDIIDGIKQLARSTEGTFIMGPKVRQRCALTGFSSTGSKPWRATPASKESPLTPLQSLTGREIEVLRLIGKGLSRNEIAKALVRSVKTVDGHQERIMKKLSITSRADLMRFAIREGLAEA